MLPLSKPPRWYSVGAANGDYNGQIREVVVVGRSLGRSVSLQSAQREAGGVVLLSVVSQVFPFTRTKLTTFFPPTFC